MTELSDAYSECVGLQNAQLRGPNQDGPIAQKRINSFCQENVTPPGVRCTGGRSDGQPKAMATHAPVQAAWQLHVRKRGSSIFTQC
jgi:hypothetical protein